MSVKGKVKKLNKELIKLRDDLETERLSNSKIKSNEYKIFRYKKQITRITRK